MKTIRIGIGQPPAKFLPLPRKLDYNAMFLMMQAVASGRDSLNITEAGFGKWRISSHEYDGPIASSPIAAIKAAWKDLRDPDTVIHTTCGGGDDHEITWNGRTWQMEQSIPRHNCSSCAGYFKEQMIATRLELEKFLNPPPPVDSIQAVPQ